jgi:hypothetical protein
VELQGEHRGIAGEITIRRQYLPAAAESGGANEEVDCRSGYASGPALVVEAGGFFIVGCVERNFLKGSELVAQFLEGGFFADAGKQFLPDWAYQLSASILDEFPLPLSGAALWG